MADPVAFVHRYHAALNALDLAAVETMLAANAVYVSPSIGAIHGRDNIMAAMRGYFAEYPDQHAVDDTVEALDTSRVRSVWRLRATSKSTGAPYVRNGAEIITVENGLIVRVEVQDA